MKAMIYKEIPNLERLKVKKPCDLGNKKVFNIFYDYGDGKEAELVIQTPPMYIPYSVIFSEDMRQIQFDCCHEQFVKGIRDIEAFVMKKVSSKYPEFLSGKTHVQKIKQHLFGNALRFKIKDAEDVPVFDQEENRLPISGLKADKKVSLIFGIRWFWIASQYYGLDMNVYQVMVHVPPVGKCLFLKDVQGNEGGGCVGDPRFEKYIKMKKLGIPLMAIEHKMKFDGFSEADIASFKRGNEGKSMGLSLPPPPPPPPPSASALLSMSMSSIVKAPLGFLNQIKNREFKLRQVAQPDPEEEKKKQIMTKMSKFVDTNKTVPTLEDILKGKGNLKKTYSPYKIESGSPSC